MNLNDVRPLLDAPAAAALMTYGPDDSAAVDRLVMWATTPEERSVVGTLGDLPTLAAAASMGPPATLVVGAVAAIPREVLAAAKAADAYLAPNA